MTNVHTSQADQATPQDIMELLATEAGRADAFRKFAAASPDPVIRDGLPKLLTPVHNYVRERMDEYRG